MSAPVSLRRIRMASYNVHSCRGRDGNHDPGRIAAVIGEMSPDIIGLQEIDTGYRVDHDQLAQLERSTGMRAIGGPTMRRGDCFFGNALLTKHPVLSVRHHDLSVPGREPRGLLDVEVSFHGKPLRYLVTHLGLRYRERKAQAGRILELLYRIQHPLIVLCGDFNDWVLTRPITRHLDRHLGPTRQVRTFPAHFPLFPLDKLWLFSEQGAVTGFDAHRSRLTRVASDHLPLLVEAVY